MQNFSQQLHEFNLNLNFDKLPRKLVLLVFLLHSRKPTGENGFVSVFFLSACQRIWGLNSKHHLFGKGVCKSMNGSKLGLEYPGSIRPRWDVCWVGRLADQPGCRLTSTHWITAHAHRRSLARGRSRGSARVQALDIFVFNVCLLRKTVRAGTVACLKKRSCIVQTNYWKNFSCGVSLNDYFEKCILKWKISGTHKVSPDFRLTLKCFFGNKKTW